MCLPFSSLLKQDEWLACDASADDRSLSLYGHKLEIFHLCPVSTCSCTVEKLGNCIECLYDIPLWLSLLWPPNRTCSGGSRPFARDLSPAAAGQVPRRWLSCGLMPVLLHRSFSLSPFNLSLHFISLNRLVWGSHLQRISLFDLVFDLCLVLWLSFRVYLYILQTAVFALLIKIRFLLSCLFLTVTEKGDEKNIRKKIFLQYLALQQRPWLAGQHSHDIIFRLPGRLLFVLLNHFASSCIVAENTRFQLCWVSFPLYHYYSYVLC